MDAERPRKRDSKRDLIVAAATEVLRHQGVAACTVRTIAETSGLSKSAIHYYFEEVDQIVDLAFIRLMGQFIDRIEQAAAQARDPVEALWAAAAVYLRLGSDQPGGDRAPMLAFDFHVASTRRGDTKPMDSLVARVLALFERLVAEAGGAHPKATADILLSALIGTVIRAPLDHREADEAVKLLATTLGLPWARPAAKARTATRARKA